VRRFLTEQRPLPGLPDTVPSGVTVVMAGDEAVLSALTGGAVPEWGAGVAVPSRNLMVVPSYPSDRGRGALDPRVLRHEWAHLALHRYLEPLRIPRWFDEGYAEWAGGWDATEAWRLRILLATGRAPPLDSLALAWPADRASARAAYLLSASVVEYLVRESGEGALRIFLERWRSIRSFEGALRITYGLTSGQLEEDWRDWVRKRYGWVFVLSRSAVFWGVLALLLVLMVRIRKRRDRERMARLRAGEPPEEPAYWTDQGQGDGEDGDTADEIPTSEDES